MRINVYSQELTSEVNLVAKESDTGETYHAVQLMLHSSPMLHHPPADDDRSAVTFWLPKSQARREEVAKAFERIAEAFRTATPAMQHFGNQADTVQERSARTTQPAAPTQQDGAFDDPIYTEAVEVVTTTGKASVSWVQRQLKIGYNRAAHLLEKMEIEGIVGPMQSNGTRAVL
jgi:DNA segregation ATPase FtsK/SpoIIIE-like protein